MKLDQHANFGIITVLILGILFFGGVYVHNSISLLNWEAYMIFLVGVLAACVSYYSFKHTHKIDRMRASRELFENFNRRYDRLNGRLNNIYERSKNDGEILSSADMNVLYDYFNLCGEEYYYYCMDYIPDAVWKAWRSGISYFFKSQRIKDEWCKEEEKLAPSYYGLSYDAIMGNSDCKNQNK